MFYEDYFEEVKYRFHLWETAALEEAKEVLNKRTALGKGDCAIEAVVLPFIESELASRKEQDEIRQAKKGKNETQ